MNSYYLKGKLGAVLLGVSLLLGLGMISSTQAQSQWPWGRDRDYRRDRDYGNDRYGRGRYGNYGYQVARDRGYQDGLQTGASDASRRQNYNPQRSHFFKNGTNGYDRSFGNKGQYKQVYRDSFVQGYNEGFRRYGGYGRNNGRWFPW